MPATSSARRHAQAVFEIARERDEIERWRTCLRTLSSALKDPEILAILENPRVPLENKQQVIDALFPDLDRLPLNFAYYLVSRQRLALLDHIADQYDRMADAHQGLEKAEVTTAVPLDKNDTARLTSYLASVTGGKRITLQARVDPEILGGFVARIGDRLIDASTRAKLEALKKQLAAAA
ncbi:MAG: ATP synthase F1 subunit delta [Dehalococcoidia bacterium]|nr:ATP synthase F1 subunit delta [Dehalococcoidia bacterium]